MMWIILVSCASEEMKRAASSSSINAYARLAEDASWTYREDLVEEDTADLPSDNLLIRARVVEANINQQDDVDEYSSSLEGSYRVELRQGARWFDARLYGELSWRLEDGLFLDNWSFESASGTGGYPIASAAPFDENTVSEGDWSCSLEELETLWTWYATYENVLNITCTGSGPAGVFTFAEQAGLIAMELDEHQLYLVAPW